MKITKDGHTLTHADKMHLALANLKVYKQEFAEYEEEKRKAGGWLDHCVHGTYIGTPGGPDYLCGPCEDGDTDPYIMALSAAHNAVRNDQDALRDLSAVFGSVVGLIWNPSLRDFKEDAHAFGTVIAKRMNSITEKYEKED